MATAAAAAAGDSALPPWILAHGIHDLGIAHFTHLKVRSSGSFIRLGYIYVRRLPTWIDSTWGFGGRRACVCVFFQTGAPTLEQRMATVAIDGTPAHKSIAAAGQSIRKALDCQTFIVSLFPKGRVERDMNMLQRTFLYICILSDARGCLDEPHNNNNNNKNDEMKIESYRLYFAVDVPLALRCGSSCASS